MRGSAKVLAVLAAMAALMVAAPTTQAAFPGENGKIAVSVVSQVGRFEFHWNIYVVNPDGSGPTAITSDNTSSGPAWSPDGSKIAFGTYRGGNPDLFTMNADGSDVTPLTNDPAGEGLPAWSPDGSKIVFARSGDLYTMNVGGTELTQITEGAGSDHSPAWSPLGNEIAFARSRWDPNTATSTTSIYLVDADGAGAPALLVPKGHNPDWSPDGRKIAFSDNQIWALDVAAGAGPVRLTSDHHTSPEDPFIAFHGDPAWSPDGTKIAFSQIECGPGACGSASLELINSDGTGRERISFGYSPDWQPLVGPQREDFKNAAHFCKALREFLGNEGFLTRYGGGANAHGKCVSGK